MSSCPQKVVSIANIHSPSWGGSWFRAKTAEGSRRLEGIQISSRGPLHLMPWVQWTETGPPAPGLPVSQSDPYQSSIPKVLQMQKHRKATYVHFIAGTPAKATLAAFHPREPSPSTQSFLKAQELGCVLFGPSHVFTVPPWPGF